MVEARMVGIGTAVPKQRFAQMDLYRQTLEPFFQKTGSRAEKIFENIGVDYRHLAVDPRFYTQNWTTEVRNRYYMQAAKELGQEAVQCCLESAGMGPEEIDDFIVVSCTGIDTPGLDLILAGALNMRPDLCRSTILGMGCYAAIRGLERAVQSVMANPGRNTLLLAVEICSLHFQPGEDTLENAVCSALFSDGAAAVIISSRPEQKPIPHPRLVDFSTHCDYQTLDQMAFHLTDHGFHMRLSAYVPKLFSTEIEHFVDAHLARNQLSRHEIQLWGVHPGSAKILDYTKERLNLDGHALGHSYAVLSTLGNMSSPTILFILQKILQEERPEPGTHAVLLAFGPGLTMDSVLIEW